MAPPNHPNHEQVTEEVRLWWRADMLQVGAR